jgi:APA family basic amino acid/polyamine antiporter
MARNQLFYKPAATVHPKFQTPHVALMLQGSWSIVLLITGSFDLITSMYVFVNWTLYLLMASAVFVLRVRKPNAERPFRTPGYPFVPAIFIIFALAYIIITLVADIEAYQAGTQPLIKSLTGIALVLTGLPFYYFWRSKRRNDNAMEV